MSVAVSVGAGSTVAVVLQKRSEKVLTHSKARPIVAVVKDSTSTVIVATIVGDDGTALDLSAATGSLYFHASTQDGVSVSYQAAASWTTDGSDGKIQHAVSAGEVGSVRALNCEFEIQGYNGGNLITESFSLRVLSRAAVAP